MDFKQNNSLIKIDEITKNEQKNDLTKIDSKLFSKMITSSGESISELNQKGWKVLLFFSAAVGCPHCQGTMEDVYALHDQLLKLNTIPVICHGESNEKYGEFIQTNERTKKYEIFKHLDRNDFVEDFKLEKENPFVQMLSYAKSGLSELRRLSGLGVKSIDTLAKPERPLAACFVIQDSKVVSEYRKEHKYQRFDVARIVLDTDGFGIEIHTSVFQCEIPKKEKLIKPQNTSVLIRKDSISKSGTFSRIGSFLKSPRNQKEKAQPDLKEVLMNPSYLSYFKLFATQEFNVENIIFFEEVTLFRLCSDEKLKGRAIQIKESFLCSDSAYEINTSQKLIKVVESKIENEEFDVEMFDKILSDLEFAVFTDMFSRFSLSEMYEQMIDDKKKKANYLLYQ
jgi:hypothetical protein